MPESRRQHIATQWFITGGGSVLRCYCGEWESDRQDTARAQRDAHRAHRVARGETVAPLRPTVKERLRAAEADLERVRAAATVWATSAPEQQHPERHRAFQNAGQAVLAILDKGAPFPPGAVTATTEETL